jgi:hypothetical protein
MEWRWAGSSIDEMNMRREQYTVDGMKRGESSIDGMKMRGEQHRWNEHEKGAV